MGDDIDRIVADFQTEMSAIGGDASPGKALAGLRTSMGKEEPPPPPPPPPEARPSARESWTPSWSGLGEGHAFGSRAARGREILGARRVVWERSLETDRGGAAGATWIYQR